MRHLKQIAYLDDPTRNKFVLAGRRGGKTSGFREELLEKATTCPPYGEMFYIGPTNQDAKDLIWDDLESRLFDLNWKFKPKVSKSRFELTRGRKIYVIGAEKIRRVRGHKVWHATLDEIAYYSMPLQKIWRAVKPSLTDLKGSASMGTTPDNKGSDSYKFYMAALTNPRWKVHMWNTADNPYIDKAEIEDAKKELDEKSFRAEYEACWESFGNLAYYNFDENKHLEHCTEFDDQYPYDLMLDFNVNPTTLLVGQLIPQFDHMHAFTRREFSIHGQGSTIETTKMFCEEFKDKHDKIKIRVHGDSSGNNRSSNTGFSDYHYLKEILKEYRFDFEMCVPGKNPNPIDRVAHVNGWLKNTHGKSRISIDHSCKELITDLSSQELNGRHPSDKNNLGHKGDAFGYYIIWWHRMLSRKSTGTVQL